jgi:hypothetical protein
MVIPVTGWVAPFGDPGINDRSHLPRAFRSVPRPSSPLSAKASTRCPYFALLAPHPTANTIGGGKLSFFRRHFVRDFTRRPGPGTNPHGPRAAAISRGHTTRFFTICHRQRAPASHDGICRGQTRSCCRVPRPVLKRRRTGGAGGGGGGGDRARTDDPLLAKQVLSQLSYTPLPDDRDQ